MKNLSWVGPFKIEQVLRHSTDDSFSRPPEMGSAYLVSLDSWRVEPTKDCRPLYIGGTTGRSKRFRTRIGDLFADLFGFFGEAQLITLEDSHFTTIVAKTISIRFTCTSGGCKWLNVTAVLKWIFTVGWGRN